MNYIYYEEKIYIHSAKKGHKIDLIRKSPKVYFCVIDKDTLVPEEFTSYFRSVIVFGEARLVEDEKEKRRLIRLLSDHFCPAEIHRRDRVIKRNWANLLVVEIRIDHISGKEAAELVSP